MSHHQDALEHDLAELFGEARRMMTPDGDPALAAASRRWPGYRHWP